MYVRLLSACIQKVHTHPLTRDFISKDKHGDVDDDKVISDHKTAYDEKSASSLSADSLGNAAALQVNSHPYSQNIANTQKKNAHLLFCFIHS